MDEEYYVTLAKVRLERSEELLAEAKDLLGKGAYKLRVGFQKKICWRRWQILEGAE